MNHDEIPYSAEFRKVLKIATAYAAGSEDHLFRLIHLLAAFCKENPKLLARLFGLETLLVPENFKFAGGKKLTRVTLSTQAHKILSLHGGELDIALHALGEKTTEIGLTHLALALSFRPHGPMLELLRLNGVDVNSPTFLSDVSKRAEAQLDVDTRRRLETERPERTKNLREIRQHLLSVCHGQDAAISSLIANVAATTSESASNRDHKPLSFFFIGGSGTGKSLVAETFRREFAKRFDAGIPDTLDMARFSVESLVVDITGRDSGWKDGGKTGELTRLSALHPNGVIILENIEKAHPGALAPIAKILTDGSLFDEYTKKKVSFANNILIFTTNVGAATVDSGAFARLCERAGGTIPREKLIENLTAALRVEAPGKDGILGEILSKASCPILFHRHSATSLAAIAEDHIRETLFRLANRYNTEVEADVSSLVAFFIETLQNLDSAHGLARSIESVLSTQLEEKLLDAETLRFPLASLMFAVDDLPALTRPTDSLEARTAQRLREAKRLDYKIVAHCAANEVVLQITGLKHTMLPSIEDAGWFSVVPGDVKAEDLVGLETAWKEARRILSRLDAPASTEAKAGHMLLYGPPGTGKTAFAKAIANTLDRSIICVNASRFTATAHPSEGVDLLNDLFAAAERTRSVIFIDECDAIGSRENASSGEGMIVNTLLTLLDGFEDHGVLVIGATNLPDRLDPALTRAGRLHSRIKIDVLRLGSDRAKLIDIFCRKTGHTFGKALKDFIVKATYEWSPADILSVLRRTIDLADGHTPTREHFVKARILDFAGEETQFRALTGEDRRHVALHEAGHALIASLYGHSWIQVSVNGFNKTAGFLETSRNFSIGHTRRELLETIDIALAGNAAERLMNDVAEGSDSDFRKATAIAERVLSSSFDDGNELAFGLDDSSESPARNRRREKINAILKMELERTLKMLEEHKPTLLKLADELAARGTLFPDDFDRRLSKEVTR